MSAAKETGCLLYAASESCADLWYEAGFPTTDDFLWYAVGERRGIVINVMELARAQAEGRPGLEVMTPKAAAARWGLAEERPKTSDLIAALAAYSGVKTWQVPANFPFALARTLLDKGLELEAVQRFCPQRAIKTAKEVAWLREGVQLAEAGLRRAEQVLRESVIDADNMVSWQDAVLTAERLRGEINAEVARCGGTASHTITAPGVQGASPHCEGSGPIAANVPIVLDIFPRCDRTGYYGDLTRTLVKGRAADCVRRAFASVQRAQREALAMLAPGVIAKTVHERVEAVFAEDGYETVFEPGPARGFFHSTGHGLGLDIHEYPGLNLRNDEPLLVGNVVTVEPGLYYPEWGGIRIEDVAVITSDGAENLTTAPVYLEIP
ncbi:MAG: M24 family metallopeptidase [Lentisphaeria bacterium]|jgi:Xaa-Pro aminopeptidase